jgi:hypothetical protein
MSRVGLATASLGAALAVAVGSVGPAPLSLTLGPPSSPAEPYAVDFAAGGGRLVRFDPATLSARPGPSVRVDGHLAAWSFSRDRRLLALGEHDDATIRIVDTARMQLVGQIDPGLGGPLLATHWVSPGRLLAVAGQRLVTIDVGRRRVERRERLAGSPIAAARTPARLLLLLAPPFGRVGAASLAVADRDGAVRTLRLTEIPAGSEDIDHGRSVLFRETIPGLAVDPEGERAFVVAADAPVAEINLRTMGVAYHTLARPVSVLGRLHDWLEPRAEAKAPVIGPRRYARWLGGGAIAVWGFDGRADARDVARHRQKAAGLAVVDVRDWTVTALDRGASEAAFADGLVLATASLWGSAGRRARGMGLSAYAPDGSRRFHLFGSAPLTGVEVVGDRAILTRVERSGRQRYVVVDLTTGRVAAELRPRTSFVLLNGPASPWLG